MLTPAVEARLATLMAHPRFGEAIGYVTREDLALFASLPTSRQWLLKDLYALSLALAAIMLQFLNGQVTTADLSGAATAGTCSANRARGFVEKARALGLISFSPDERIWTIRPLTLNPSLTTTVLDMTKISLRGASMIIPELRDLASQIDVNHGFHQLLAAGAMMSIAGSELFEEEPQITFFTGRVGGGRFLESMTAARSHTPANREKAFALGRSKLAAAMGVSRIHLNRLLADAEERAYVKVQAEGITLSTDCSHAYDHFMARLFEIAFQAATLAGLIPLRA